MTSKRILLIEDDEVLREGLGAQLDLDPEFETVGAENGAAALDIVKRERVDLILLDVGLPDFDGRELCRIIRRIGVTCPVIMLTGADSEADTILGLDSGANDYVAKPVRYGVLLARIRAQFRHFGQNADAAVPIGPYNLRPRSRVLHDPNHNRTIRLTEKETAILTYLYRTGDKVVGRAELLDSVWGYHPETATHTVETHIYRLRQKIEPDPGHARILLREGDGYRLAR